MEVSWDIIEFAGMVIMILVFGLFLLHLQDTVKAADPEKPKAESRNYMAATYSAARVSL